MARALRDRLQMLFEDLAWHEYVFLFEGWANRAAILVPIIGYVILFNDVIAKEISFDFMTSDQSSLFLFSSVSRIRFIYFGLFLLGVSSLIYLCKRPWVIRYGASEIEFVSYGLSRFSGADYLWFKRTNRLAGKGDMPTRDYQTRWAAFESALSKYEHEIGLGENHFEWQNIRRKFEIFLSSVLRETFHVETRKRRVTLMLCIALSALGYLLLIIPSIDLFQAVLRSTFSLGFGAGAPEV